MIFDRITLDWSSTKLKLSKNSRKMSLSDQIKNLIRTGKKDVNYGNPNGAYPFFTCAKENTFSNEYSFDT